MADDEESLSATHIMLDPDLVEQIETLLAGKIQATVNLLPDGLERIDVTINIETLQVTVMTPQQKHKQTYTLFASASGVVFLVILLGISVLVPNPTPSQLRIWIPIMALAAGGFGTTFTGLINVKAKLGTQIFVGATGAFGVLVLFYLVNPAIL
ncbi:MAG: hypothetical protein JNM20_03125 [Rhizobiales bacterium]|nr:hypothetical protein [Hyphomicrobiales bacterium]